MCYMPSCLCIQYLHAHSAGSQCEPLCARVCLSNADGSTFRRPSGGKKEERKRRWESGRMDKKDRVQSSEADDCVFAEVQLFIADATEISIEMISATDFAPDISDGRRPNVYVYRAVGGKGTVVCGGVMAHMWHREIIGEVRLGGIRKSA